MLPYSSEPKLRFLWLFSRFRWYTGLRTLRALRPLRLLRQKVSKVPYIVTVYRKCIRALTFENVWQKGQDPPPSRGYHSLSPLESWVSDGSVFRFYLRGCSTNGSVSGRQAQVPIAGNRSFLHLYQVSFTWWFSLLSRVTHLHTSANAPTPACICKGIAWGLMPGEILVVGQLPNTTVLFWHCSRSLLTLTEILVVGQLPNTTVDTSQLQDGPHASACAHARAHSQPVSFLSYIWMYSRSLLTL